VATDNTLKKIGRYEIESLVAEGSMAVVYRARDPDIDRTVAIKVLKDEHGVDEEHVNRFLREAKAAGAISHPNIVTIYDVGRIDNTFYITMELLDRKSLADVLAENARLSIRQVISIGIQLARALDVAHRKGIVHRDIKPGNILLTETCETVKITDFGIAWLDRPDDMQKTHPGMVLGTPRYMSPEQAAGRELDGRSDLFSLGVILYELLSGRKAFDSNNVATLMLQISLANPTPLRTIVPEISEGLQRVIMRLLNKFPEQRFQSGAEVADALERELAAAMAQETKPARNRPLPLRVKAAALAGLLTAAFWVIGMAIVGSVESRGLERQLLDSGATLAKSIAAETAVPLLAKDWIALELFAGDGNTRDTFDYLAVTDRQNVVRASTDKAIVGKPFVPPKNAAMRSDNPDVAATSVLLPGGEAAVLFDTKILFQKREVGHVYLGVGKAGMQSVSRSTFLALSSLGVLAVLGVVGMCLFFGGLVARCMRLLRDSLLGLGAGDLERRISVSRNDEIGEVFTAFNRMAESLQAGVAKRNGEGGETGMLPDANRLLAMEACADPEATLLFSSEPAAPAGLAEPLKSPLPVESSPPERLALPDPPESDDRRTGSRKQA